MNETFTVTGANSIAVTATAIGELTTGVLGTGDAVGVFGTSETGRGVVGTARTATAVEGNSVSADGVVGTSETRRGVVGISKIATAVEGNSVSGAGVWGDSKSGEGVHGQTQSATFAAVAAFMLNPNGVGAALYAENRGQGVGVFAKGGRLAALFEGDVEVTGDIRLTNADCAEDFDIVGLVKVEPGTVMVIDTEGALRESDRAYDKRVAGVISGAGNYKPGLILDKQQDSSSNRMPIALMGKVYCKVDASYGSIEVGDLLTTSPTTGHAMKADDPMKAFGSVIGKALRPLDEGQGLIPILIALQ
jgi:hypothetical protein